VPSRRPFRDYLAWLAAQDEAAADDHWRRTLAGFDTTTPLPYDDHPRAAHEAAATESVSIDLPGEALRTIGRANGLTLGTILQGVWAILLSRHGGGSDIVFGTTVSGRPAELPGVESMIGMFINTVPTRVDVDGAATLLPWLRALQAAQTEARRFDHVALSQLHACTELPAEAPLLNQIRIESTKPDPEDKDKRQATRMR